MRKDILKLLRDKKYSVRANEELISKALKKINSSCFLKYLFNFSEKDIFTISDLLEVVAMTILTDNTNVFNFRKSFNQYMGIVSPEEQKKQKEIEEQKKINDEYYKLRFEKIKKHLK